MFGSVVVYAGVVIALLGTVLAARSLRITGGRARRHGVAAVPVGIVLAAIGLILPARQSRIAQVTTRLDEFVPAWQFGEYHTIRIAAPPERVFAALRHVRADEIALFRTLTWMRRGGRSLPEGILNPGKREALLDVATRTDFVLLAVDEPREVVIGTIVLRPRTGITEGRALTPATFRGAWPPGFVLAAMNFVVRGDGAGGSVVATETRVFANSTGARRRFAVYWRLIYPGSALIRRMWLRAIARRAVLSA